MNPGPQPELLYSHNGEITWWDFLSAQQTTSDFQLPSGGTVAVFDYNSKVTQNIGMFVVAYKSHNTPGHVSTESLFW